MKRPPRDPFNDKLVNQRFLVYFFSFCNEISADAFNCFCPYNELSKTFLPAANIFNELGKLESKTNRK